MNLLHVRDAHGQLLRTDLLDGFGVIDVGLLPGGGTVVIVPMPGYQLNGHLHDCRCSTCRPDLNGGPGG